MIISFNLVESGLWGWGNNEAIAEVFPLLRFFLSYSSFAPFILVSEFTWKVLINHKEENSSVNVFVHTDTSVRSKRDSVTKERMSQKLIKIDHQFISPSDLHMTRLNYISGVNMYFLIIRSLKITLKIEEYSSPSKKTCQTLNKNVTNPKVHF